MLKQYAPLAPCPKHSFPHQDVQAESVKHRLQQACPFVAAWARSLEECLEDKGGGGGRCGTYSVLFPRKLKEDDDEHALALLPSTRTGKH